MKEQSDKSKKVRLQKFLADLGYCSRREAEEWIQDGLVTVNGHIPVLGTKVDLEEDSVKVRGKLVKVKSKPKRVVLAVNKPRGVLCSNEDPYHEETIFTRLPKPYQGMRLFCAGRLDKESQGLLILTNDGALAQRITHPSHGLIKKYFVTLSKPYEEEDIQALLKGIRSEGETLKAAKVVRVTTGPKADCQLEVHLQQGRKREVRRMFEAMGYWVHRLKRIQIGGYKLRKMGTSFVKELIEEDVALLLKIEQ